MQTVAVADRQRPPPGDLYLDHVAHFVPDLAAAGGALEALGFRLTPETEQTTRAPDGSLVPAGTRFRSAMLRDGYLELIQPLADTPRTRRMRARMAGRAGIHLASFGTPAAADEHDRLRRHGFEPLALVQHERAVSGGQGMLTARYRLAHVPHDKMPEGRIEYIEHETPAVLWQDRWVADSNAQCALAFLFVATSDVAATAARWAHFSGVLPEPAGARVRMRLARGQVLIGTPEAWAALLGTNVAPAAIAGYGLAVETPGTLIEKMRQTGCTPRTVAEGVWAVHLPAALGGSWLIGTRSALEALFDSA